MNMLQENNLPSIHAGNVYFYFGTRIVTTPTHEKGSKFQIEKYREKKTQIFFG